MRLRIDHHTGFSYDAPVRASYNQARMTPVNGPTQTVWSSRLTIEPSAWSHTSTDYFGTTVTTFELHEPHERLSVRANAVVDTHVGPEDWAGSRRVPGTDAGWDVLRSPAVLDDLAEYLELGPRTRPHPELLEAARGTTGEPPRLAALDVCRLIADAISYTPGATQVNSSAHDVWTGGQGVCQDFSHVAVGALRSIGIPARYVSGYLHPSGSAARVGEAVQGESHSWLEWWCGEWVAFDPTGMSQIGEHYVRVGHGRDYGDVPPLRGTYAGGGSSMFVTVTITQLG